MRMELIVTFARRGEGPVRRIGIEWRSDGSGRATLADETVDEADEGFAGLPRVLRFSKLAHCKPVRGEEAPGVRQLGARGLRTVAG
jgi:hypothetical protein